MDNRFFFITTYDGYSGQLLASVLNQHPDVNCLLSNNDPFIAKLSQAELKLKPNIDTLVTRCQNNAKKYHCSIQHYAAFELQHYILVQKTKARLRKGNITMAPRTRINFLIHNWLQTYKHPEIALENIKQKLPLLQQSGHDLFELYNFNYFYEHILKNAKDENIDSTSTENQLFFLALAKTITYDSADLATTNKMFQFEKLISEEKYFSAFTQYLTGTILEITPGMKRKLTGLETSVKNCMPFQWKGWQKDFLNTYLHIRLNTVYYPHIDKPLISFYDALEYRLTPSSKNQQTPYEKLISIQLNSNRPSQLCTYFDNIEETTDNLCQIEVLINIDEDDRDFEEVIKFEAAQRKFTIKYITTAKPNSFCDLWQPINKLLEITDPNAYFLLNISDEMLFSTKGWDSILKKYVGFFPDHIFRLRASRNKFRNYFDRWECSFGQDSIPITTKRWVDIGGNWNPCFGPDSFQQLIAFYLAKEGAFSSTNYLRELPIIDIQFHGDVPSLGMDRKKAWKHSSDHIKALQICQSYKIQLEARRRAILLKAHMMAASMQLQHYDVVDNQSKKQIHLIEKNRNIMIAKLDYRLSWCVIFITNQLRKFRFNAYFGGGKADKKNLLFSFAGYLRAKYFCVYWTQHRLTKFFHVICRSVARTRYLLIIFVKKSLKCLLKVYKYCS